MPLRGTPGYQAACGLDGGSAEELQGQHNTTRERNTRAAREERDGSRLPYPPHQTGASSPHGRSMGRSKMQPLCSAWPSLSSEGE